MGAALVLLRSIGGHTGAVNVAAADGMGAAGFASGGYDGVARVWSAEGAQLAEIAAGAAINRVVSLSSREIAIATSRGPVLLDTA